MDRFYTKLYLNQFSSVQSLSHVWLFVKPWFPSLSITNSRSLPRLMSIESVMPSSYLILCHPLLLSPIPPSIRVFSNESTLHMRWPKYWSNLGYQIPNSFSLCQRIGTFSRAWGTGLGFQVILCGCAESTWACAWSLEFCSWACLTSGLQIRELYTLMLCFDWILISYCMFLCFMLLFLFSLLIHVSKKKIFF